MHFPPRLLAACVLAAVVVALNEDSTPLLPAAPAAPSEPARGDQLLARVPTAFVPNLGQWEHDARYVARLGPVTAFLKDRGWWLTLVERTGKPLDPRAMPAPPENAETMRGAALRMTFAGSGAAELVAEDRLAGVHNYFLGKDPTRWRTDVPRYAGVQYRGLYPGVDVRAYGKDGHFEYDLVLAPGADLSQVVARVEGANGLHLDSDGALVIDTSVGPLRQGRPPAYVVDGGVRRDVACGYELRGDDRFGFTAPHWDGASRLVLDPGLVWSTFLGGTGYERVNALALDAGGVATVAGETNSPTFPTTAGAFATSFGGGNYDAFVARLSPSGKTLVYATFLGGTDDEFGAALALDANGAPTIAGWTGSSDFPTTAGSFDTRYNGGGYDAIVVRLSPSGGGLAFGTYLGGEGLDLATAMAVDASGRTTVAGVTRSSGFPTTPGAFDTTFNGGPFDTFVARLSPTGNSLIYSTLLGASRTDYAYALALDPSGAVFVAGTTDSRGFPTTAGALSQTHNGGYYDAFVTKLAPSGASVVYSTLIGGSIDDEVRAIAVDPSGAATVAGGTNSWDFPTTPGAFQTTNSFFSDAFVARLDPSGGNLLYSTFLGGGGFDNLATAVAIDTDGTTTVVGNTTSADFPTTPGAFDTTFNSTGAFYSDVFVSRLSMSGSSLLYSTFLGGSSSDWGFAVALDPSGAATLAGASWSPDFPTTPGAFNASLNAAYVDAFVTRMDLLPVGVSAFGNSSPGCTGSLAIGVNSMPSVGNAAFAITCNNAPLGVSGVALLATSSLTTAIPVLGVLVWVDPLGLAPIVGSNGVGAAEFPLPVPRNAWLVSQRLQAQFVWLGPASPAPCPPLGLSASNALEFTIQP